ncbi:MAG: glycoside hydrolase family 92 protein, partial [Bacteroidaceae bacterium]|nr:glycoside hydrolase family 92 protein [Bacteroidaceae bacterium]
MRNILSILFFVFSVFCSAKERVTDYVDPRIGSIGLGRVFIGPSCPYGMCKPGPDCGVGNNPGWAAMPAAVSGFSQTHVSGTGGGPKYGNILLNFFGKPQHRKSEDVSLGYYGCLLEESGCLVQITAAERAAYYRVLVPKGASSEVRLKVDIEHFLGKNPVPKAREAQQYEGGEVNYSDDGAISGWQRISGGWNNGAPYTVYFYAEKQESMSFDKDKASLSSLSLLGGEYESFVADISKVVDVKIGISFVSVDKAKQNLREDIPHWDFSVTYNECIDKWNRILAKVELAPETSKEYKRMFYTAL